MGAFLYPGERLCPECQTTALPDDYEGDVCEECEEDDEYFPYGNGYVLNPSYGFDRNFRKCDHGDECICPECCNERGEEP